MAIRISVETPTIKFKQNLAGVKDRMDAAISAATNMAASMIESLGKADIASAGNFGSRWVDGLHVNVTGGTLGRMRISMTHDVPYAGIFEEGGEIKGNPLLWLPLSGTDAVGIQASSYPGGLFSVNRRSGGAPLLFSLSDKLPKYFGIESVTIPKKFHLREIQRSVMGNFRALFDNAFRGGV